MSEPESNTPRNSVPSNPPSPAPHTMEDFNRKAKVIADALDWNGKKWVPFDSVALRVPDATGNLLDKVLEVQLL